MPKPWSKEDTKTARSMWNKGHTGGEIAAWLGVTRNAVMGKMQRLGLIGERRGKRGTGNKYFFKEIIVGHTEHYLCDSPEDAKRVVSAANAYGFKKGHKMSVRTRKEQDQIIVAITKVS